MRTVLIVHGILTIIVNIVENAGVQIKTLSWQDIGKSLYGIAGGGRWQRPVSYFTFAVNYYFDGLNVFWYHVVNFFIHYVTSVFLIPFHLQYP